MPGIHTRRITQGLDLGAEYTAEQLAFMFAVDRYKRVNQRPYPMWSEVLAVALSLGYRLVDQPGPLPTYPPPVVRRRGGYTTRER